MDRLPTQLDIRRVVVDPRNPKRVYANASTGIFRSDDAGRTLEAAGQGLDGVPITTLALSPSHPDTLYALARDGRIFRSENGATNWQLMQQ